MSLMNNPRQNSQVPQPCPHLSDFRSRTGHKPFRALQECLRVKPLGRAAIRRDPDEVPRCYTSICCHKPFRARSASESSHSVASRSAAIRTRSFAVPLPPVVTPHSSSLRMRRLCNRADYHAESMPPGHEIAVDVDRAELFCCVCRDQVFDRDFDAAVVLAQTAASTLGGGLTLPPALPLENQKKRRRVDYRPWTPDPRERFLMGRGSSPLQRGDEDSYC